MQLHIKYHNEWMKADEKGFISRPAINMSASGQWRITGAVRLNNFGHIVERFSLADILANANEMQWQYKNGSQRIHITDLDHGTHRTWMSPTHSLIVTN